MCSREYRERLIDEVRRCPVLYDTRHEAHRDVDARDRCWADISQRLGANSEVLKREWKILRDSLRQSIKKHRRGAKTKAGAPCKPWRFQQRMAFVLPYMTRRGQRRPAREAAATRADDPEPHSECEDEHWDQPPGPGPGPGLGPGPGPGPRGGGGRGDPQLAALDLFFASVCASARRLPAAGRAQLKRRVLDELLRAEAEHEHKAEPVARAKDEAEDEDA